MCDWPDWAKKGCLLGYEPNPADLRRRTTDFVARILRGTPAGELPIGDSTTIELVINLKTARAFGIDLPFWLLEHANNVIEEPTRRLSLNHARLRVPITRCCIDPPPGPWSGGVYRIGANEGTLMQWLIAPLPALKNTQRMPNTFPAFVIERKTTVTGTSNALSIRRVDGHRPCCHCSLLHPAHGGEYS
jgi:hypothetical protein